MTERLRRAIVDVVRSEPRLNDGGGSLQIIACHPLVVRELASAALEEPDHREQVCALEKECARLRAEVRRLEG